MKPDQPHGSSWAERKLCADCRHLGARFDFRARRIVLRLLKWRGGEALAMWWAIERTPMPVGLPSRAQLWEGFYVATLPRWITNPILRGKQAREDAELEAFCSEVRP